MIPQRKNQDCPSRGEAALWVLWMSRRGSGEDSLSRSEALVRAEGRDRGTTLLSSSPGTLE